MISSWVWFRCLRAYRFSQTCEVKFRGSGARHFFAGLDHIIAERLFSCDGSQLGSLKAVSTVAPSSSRSNDNGEKDDSRHQSKAGLDIVSSASVAID